MSWNEAEIMSARRAILETTQDMLAARISYIAGSRIIAAQQFAARLDSVPEILPFVGIGSEIEALPLGEMRIHWQAAALEALQPKIEQSEAWARSVGEPHCRNLVKMLCDGRFEIGPVRKD
jgi:hypothetical protein